MSGRPQPAGDGGGEAFDVALLALAAFVLGPPALAAAAALTRLARFRSRRWLWPAALAGVGVCVLLRRFIERHLTAALAAAHGGIAGRPGRLLLAVWPHLWPAWLATTAAAPLLALVLLARQGATARLDGPVDEHRRRRTARFERRIARKALTTNYGPAASGDLFLGYKLGGDKLLPTHHRRVQLPLPRLSHHLLVAGATGSGKTETALRIAYSLARAS